MQFLFKAVMVILLKEYSEIQTVISVVPEMNISSVIIPNIV